MSIKCYSASSASCLIVHYVSDFSALLGFLLLLVTVKLKSGLSLEHFGVWIFLSKVIAHIFTLFFKLRFN